MWKMALPAAGLVAIAGVSVWGLSNSECSKNGLYRVFTAEVATQLRSPSTAKFPSANEAVEIYNRKRCSIFVNESFVDSQNGFGAIVRNRMGGVVNKKRGEIEALVTVLPL